METPASQACLFAISCASAFMVFSFPSAKWGDVGEPPHVVLIPRDDPWTSMKALEYFTPTKPAAPQVLRTITEASLPGRSLAL